MRGLGLYLAILAGVVSVFLGIAYWPNHETGAPVASVEIEQQDLKLAENYFKKGKTAEALDLISQYQDSIEKQTPHGQRWLSLLTTISEQTLDIPQLALIYDHFPESLKDHEKASLLVAESFVTTGRHDEYVLLRTQWTGRETQKNAWLLLDADHLLGQNKYAEAVSLLNNSQLDGKHEGARLIRLALLHTVENPDRSLEYLAQAQQRDPLNRDVFVYQARIYESMGKGAEALTAYKQAIKNHPKDAGLYDQLAEFYLRHQQYAQALDTWQRSLELPGSDTSWLKTLFWSRVIAPTKTNWSKVQPPEGKLRPLVLYLLDLPAGKFWDDEAFSRLTDGEYFLKTQQETFWLRLLAALQNYDEHRAAQLIHQSLFREELWNPNLELAILQTLNYRKSGDFIRDPAFEPKNTALYPSLYSHYKMTNEGSQDEIDSIMKSREAFMTNFLAAGWSEAALQLHPLAVLPEKTPEWVIADLSLAIRKNRGDKEAYAFLKKQNQSPKISLMEQELAARIALEEGDENAAQVIYELLADKSAEAKSYLARKAFKEKDWVRAEQLTEELLKIYPDSNQLQDNLKKLRQLK